MRHELTVYGTPAPQGSKRAFGNRVVEVSKKVKPWRASIERAFLLNPWDTITEPFSIRITFMMPRPKTHYRTGKHAHELKDTAPRYHTTTPDIDKLVRSTMDGLTQAGAIEDDKLACILHAQKLYLQDTSPGAIIIIEGID